MKRKYIIFSVLFLINQLILACPVCDRQSPSITKGMAHGSGPNSNWEWVIIGIMTIITIFTLIYSVKYLVHPKEESSNHIKNSILSDN